MATARQIEANRLNAQKSTGPRTPEGKSASRFNSLKHGIDAASIVIPGEDPAELEALAAGYFDQFQPDGPVQRFLVETMIHSEWNKRRLARAEAQLLRSAMAGAGFESALEDRTIDRVYRRIRFAEGIYFRALTELRRAQRQARAQRQPCAEVSEAKAVPAVLPAPISLPAEQIHAIGFAPSPQPLPGAVVPASRIGPSQRSPTINVE